MCSAGGGCQRMSVADAKASFRTFIEAQRYPTEDGFRGAADAFFAAPDVSFRGWERAIDAQDRITAALHQILPDHGTGDLAIVTHGAVGTLLWCRLMNCPIDRKHDQPGQGHFWIADLRSLEPTGGWQPIA